MIWGYHYFRTHPYIDSTYNTCVCMHGLCHHTLIFYYIILYYIVLYYILLYYIILYYIILHYNPYPKSSRRVCSKNHQITFLDVSGWKLSRFKHLSITLIGPTEGYTLSKNKAKNNYCLLKAVLRISVTIGNKHIVSETNPS